MNCTCENTQRKASRTFYNKLNVKKLVEKWLLYCLLIASISLFSFASLIGIYVANLSHHTVDSARSALNFLNEGRKELIIAETRMVRQSSRLASFCVLFSPSSASFFCIVIVLLQHQILISCRIRPNTFFFLMAAFGHSFMI